MKNHLDAISKTTSRNIGILTMLKRYVPQYILYSLYCTFHLNLNWEDSCTNTKQVHFLVFFATTYSAYKKNKKFSDRPIRETGPILWNTLGNKLKQRKSAKHLRNNVQIKSNQISLPFTAE